jgi:hypothetical protein
VLSVGGDAGVADQDSCRHANSRTGPTVTGTYFGPLKRNTKRAGIPWVDLWQLTVSLADGRPPREGLRFMAVDPCSAGWISSPFFNIDGHAMAGSQDAQPRRLTR